MKQLVLGGLLCFIASSVFAQWSGQSSSSDLTSPINRTGFIAIDGYNTAQIRLNSSGTYYGKIGNPSPQVWSLGWGGSSTDVNSVLAWTATGNVGIGTTSPGSTLAIKGRFGIRADATPSTPTETMRVEGAITSEENVMNVTNLSDQDFIVKLSGAGAAVKRTIIGPSVSNRFSLGVGVSAGNEYLTLVNGGNIGIGTTNPAGKLDINAGSQYAIRTLTSSRYVVEVRNTNDTDGGWWLVNDPNGSFALHENSVGDQFTIKPGGNVGIGTTSPDAKLAVSGQVHAQEVKVSVTVPGPDYVFDKDYKLTSLEEIKNYIDQNKHLPEVPSAKEMEKNGVQLGEMNMLLLKKIEELTLYVIEQNKMLSNQQQEINTMKELLKKRIDRN